MLRAQINLQKKMIGGDSTHQNITHTISQFLNSKRKNRKRYYAQNKYVMVLRTMVCCMLTNNSGCHHRRLLNLIQMKIHPKLRIGLSKLHGEKLSYIPFYTWDLSRYMTVYCSMFRSQTYSLRRRYIDEQGYEEISIFYFISFRFEKNGIETEL